jgi:hypothetical protein
MTINPLTDPKAVTSIGTPSQKSTFKLGDPSSFQALFSNYDSGSAAAPVETTSVDQLLSGGTAPSLGLGTFTPHYEQGAYVTGPDGSKNNLNPTELATADTAAAIARLLGGNVQEDTMSGFFSSSVPTRQIVFAGSNVQINAGLAADLFAKYGDAPGSMAWRTINQDLGRDPMARGPIS